MPHAAVSQKVADAIRQAGDRVMPGHVFSLYLPFWNDEWKRAGDNAKRHALQKVCDATVDASLIKSLNARQSTLAEAANAVRIEAQSTSPFVTGMGEEHAVENGFAFLSPYGLPYLAGSGVKGVIRRAAEELAAGLNPEGTFGWTFTRVMWLFGYEENVDYIARLDEELFADDDTGKEANGLLELLDDEASRFTDLSPDKTHFMGALAFWDVIIKGELSIDILTPHFGHYYQGDESPHDAGQPQPNPFLVVAPGATFTFHITCPGEHRLPESLQGEVWRKLIKAAFNHAFEWGGFGAKTAVGYGVLQNMEAIHAMEQQRKLQEQKLAEERKRQEEQERKTIRVGDKVRDTETGEDGVVKAISGDMAVVDFYGEEYEVELSSLEKLQ